MPDLHDSSSLPPAVEASLARFVAAAEGALGPSLACIAVYGSAADGHLRATSDVNLVLVLERFEVAAIDRLREPLRVARAESAVQVMLLLAAEVDEAAEAFAVKFGDISRRRRVLAGRDVFASLHVSREAKLRRLRQELLNQVLRLRAAYATLSLREEQLARSLADTAGPLRAAAATLLELQGRPAAPSPREALLAFATPQPAWVQALATLSEAREQGRLPHGAAAPAFLAVLALAEELLRHSRQLATDAP